jgi:hypothetical protein
MEVKLIKVEGCVVSWILEGENLEEMKKLGAMRHPILWFEDTEIVYIVEKAVTM